MTCLKEAPCLYGSVGSSQELTEERAALCVQQGGDTVRGREPASSG